MGLVVSMTVFPASASGPQSAIAASAAVPFTASTTGSPKRAVSAKVPTDAFAPACFFQAASCAGTRVPRMTARPCARNPFASVSPTTPDPITPIFFAAMRASRPAPIGPADGEDTAAGSRAPAPR